MERFTVAHVLREPRLADLAALYLDGWSGTFEFLAAAKAQMNRGEKLAAPIIKGVLNCMQSDGRVMNMPTPPDLTFDAGQLDLEPSTAKEVGRVLTMYSHRPYVIRCKTTWNYQYGIALATNARAIHLVDKSVQVEWYHDQDAWVIPFGWVCNPHAYMRTKAKGKTLADYYRLITERAAEKLLVYGSDAITLHKELGIMPRNWTECRQCATKADAS